MKCYLRLALEMISVRPFAESLPELAGAAWARLDRVTPLDREVLVAFGATAANETFIASAWDEGARLRGLSMGMLIDQPTGRWLAIAHALDYAKTVLTAKEENRGDVARALLSAWLEHARAKGCPVVTLAYTEAADTAVLRAAEELGFRLMDVVSYQIDLLPDDSFDAYLSRLSPKQRRELRRDLRRVEEARAQVDVYCPPPRALLEEAWPLHLAMIERKGSPFKYRGNLYTELERRLPPEALFLRRLSRDGAFLGYLIGVRDGRTTALLYCCHQDEAPLNVYQALVALSVREEIERGARTIVLAATTDTFKRRLGSTPVLHRHGFWAP